MREPPKAGVVSPEIYAHEQAGRRFKSGPIGLSFSVGGYPYFHVLKSIRYFPLLVLQGIFTTGHIVAYFLQGEKANGSLGALPQDPQAFRGDAEPLQRPNLLPPGPQWRRWDVGLTMVPLTWAGSDLTPCIPGLTTWFFFVFKLLQSEGFCITPGITPLGNDPEWFKLIRFYAEMCLNGVNTRWVYSQGLIQKPFDLVKKVQTLSANYPLRKSVLQGDSRAERHLEGLSLYCELLAC